MREARRSRQTFDFFEANIVNDGEQGEWVAQSQSKEKVSSGTSKLKFNRFRDSRRMLLGYAVEILDVFGFGNARPNFKISPTLSI